IGDEDHKAVDDLVDADQFKSAGRSRPGLLNTSTLTIHPEIPVDWATRFHREPHERRYWDRDILRLMGDGDGALGGMPQTAHGQTASDGQKSKARIDYASIHRKAGLCILISDGSNN